jgi:hypothetical protein
MWPSSFYSGSSSSNCPPSATCIIGVADSATVTAAKVENLPPVSSCYSKSYTASTLQSQTTTTCDTSSRYCKVSKKLNSAFLFLYFSSIFLIYLLKTNKSTFAGISTDGNTADSVESSCAATCTASTNDACSLVRQYKSSTRL